VSREASAGDKMPFASGIKNKENKALGKNEE